ncbi:MAG: ATP-binding protein [Oscillospiraceae bacterium]|nr:ATP-binding protein [Oscillospiraceae bacterium]
MAIIGRKEERRQLDDYYYSGRPELIIVYGRRRIGKTFLIKEHFEGGFSFYFTGKVSSSRKGNLDDFDNAIIEYGGDKSPKSMSWADAFHKLERLLRKSPGERKVVFIDEMPWLDTGKSGFLLAFDYFWNSFASANKDILFIGCGSATSWITKKIFKNRGGLHNRVTGRIHLAPFTIGECEVFLKNRGVEMDRYQLAECYMIFGGIPYYLNLLDRGLSLSQNVDRLCFAKNASLKNEFYELYMSLFSNPTRYIAVVEALATKNSGLCRNDIIEIAGLQSNGHLSIVLDDLEQCDFIDTYSDTSKGKKGRYFFLIDPFTMFYLRYMKDNDTKDEYYWTGNINDGTRNAWRGYAFEQLCRLHLRQIKKALGISGVSTETSSWRSKTAKPGAEIDLVIRRKDRITNLCEIKYVNQPFVITKSYSEMLNNKRISFQMETGIQHGVHLTMITTYGVTKSGYFGVVHSEVTLDDLFE